MKSIMISIKPQWVEKILNGEKTIEIRKTKPKCELPCKVYVYCTKDKKHSVAPFRFIDGWKYKEYNDNTSYSCGCIANMGETINGKVVAEFTLNKVDKLYIPYSAKYLYDALNSKTHSILKQSCLDVEEILKYLKDKYYGYAWHIDNLKIYDKPKELSEVYSAKECPFKDWGDVDNIGCWESCCEIWSRGECRFGNLQLQRPPRNYCYVEEMESE